MQVTGTRIRTVMSATSLIGDDVVNRQGENLGDIKDIMIDTERGCISYAVLSYGGIFGLGDKLFAVPWEAMALDEDRKQFMLDMSKQQLENAPGFDKDNWPDMSQDEFGRQVHGFYGTTPTYGGGSQTGGMGGGYGGGTPSPF